MSHFTCLIVGDDYEGQLAPYHEFECTGEDDQYVQDLDETAEARACFEKETKKCLRSPDGVLVGSYDEQFYRDPTPEELEKRGTDFFNRDDQGLSWYGQDWKDGKGYREKVHFIPEGWTEVEVSTSTQETFAEWIEGYYGHKVVPFGEEPDTEDEHKYGYTLVDENGDVIKTVNRTNPNKKWDWFQVGGRWNGFFLLKPNTTGVIGEAGLNRMDPGYKPPTADRADSTEKENIDIDGMRQEAAAEACTRFELFTSVTAGLPPIKPWKFFLNKYGVEEGTTAEAEGGIDAARDEFHAQPGVQALRKNKETVWFDVDDYLVGPQQYIQRARNRAFSTYAFVKDGKWYEKGEMGWFGCAHNEMDEDEWLVKFNQMIDELPGDTLLTVVDCHI